MDWFHHIIGPDKPQILWWQECIRALLIFVFGLVLIRLFGRRAFGRQNALDIIFAIIIGSNLSRTLTGGAEFFPTLAATAVMAFVYWVSDHIAARWALFSRLVKGTPIPLTRDGKLDPKAMKRSGVSEGDIEESARTSGLPSLKTLRQAILERNGKISTIAKG